MKDLSSLINCDDDCEVLFSKVKNFKNEAEFLETAKKVAEKEFSCKVIDAVRKLKIISTEKGLEPQTFISLKETDVKIEDYYFIDIVDIDY